SQIDNRSAHSRVFVNNRLVMTKHFEVYPSSEELQSVQTIISHVEHAFKTVSEQVDGGRNQNALDNEQGEERVLRGLMRVGLVAKGLLLKGDKELELVLLCSNWPTVTLLNRATELLTKQLELISAGTYTVSPCPEEAAIFVKSTKESALTLVINLTSPLVRTEQPTITAEEKATFGQGMISFAAVWDRHGFFFILYMLVILKLTAL
uniref:DZF domain-containing protein n=1 Tax=Fundulus heteroclitus TaxID=8078 RepID=A0A3Q2QQL0_FUNHE